MEITVVRVEDGVVEIQALNVLFRFRERRDTKLSYTKSKPGAQVLDPGALWVPDVYFRQVYRTAAAIFKERREKKKKEKE